MSDWYPLSTLTARLLAKGRKSAIQQCWCMMMYACHLAQSGLHSAANMCLGTLKNTSEFCELTRCFSVSLLAKGRKSAIQQCWCMMMYACHLAESGLHSAANMRLGTLKNTSEFYGLTRCFSVSLLAKGRKSAIQQCWCMMMYACHLAESGLHSAANMCLGTLKNTSEFYGLTRCFSEYAFATCLKRTRVRCEVFR